MQSGCTLNRNGIALLPLQIANSICDFAIFAAASKASLMALSANEWTLPDSLLERWTKLGEAVLANGVPTEAHITEMTALAHSEQDQIKRKLRRTAKVFRAQPIEALVVAGFSI
ncbi:MAG: hypothetical protein DMG96_19890 [Acidobacteria bacterium]|nr:MAG: hypothetical protein DMG96_19890 [Acidobacteriota bacterium]